MGKCLGRGTKILMFNGELKSVETISKGDLLMGPDSQARYVLNTTKGYGPMFRIKHLHGIEYRANGNHILSLKKSRTEGMGAKGSIVNISINDYLAKSGKYKSNYKVYKMAVEWPAKELPIDPYYLGLWLGDGGSDDSRITSADQEIIGWLMEFARQNGMELHKYEGKRGTASYAIVTTHATKINRKDSMRVRLRKIGLLGNKYIPELYLINNRQNRLRLLAGLIDSDGYYPMNQNGPYEIVSKNKLLATQIKFLCDSLGYRTSLKSKRATIKSIKFECEVYRIRFNGDVNEIPTILQRKTAKPWTDRKDWQVTGLKIEPDGDGEYFGFELSGDGLFLLEDMTVTHNSQMCLQIAQRCAERGDTPAFFSLEMGKHDLLHRLVFAEARVNEQKLRRGNDEEKETAANVLKDKFSELMALPMWFDDTASINTQTAQLEMVQLLAKENISIMFFDHISLAGDTTKSGNEVQRIGEIMRGLKRIAKVCNIPIVIASQMSREVSKSRTDHRPRLEDLRSSGDLEQDADVVLGLYRHEYYFPKGVKGYKQDCENFLEILVLKQRMGAGNPRGGLSTGIFYDVKTGQMGDWYGEFPSKEVD